jgi:hypothetical protein
MMNYMVPMVNEEIKMVYELEEEEMKTYGYIEL